jgi:uncharacterized membrane protein (DUF106 family)
MLGRAVSGFVNHCVVYLRLNQNKTMPKHKEKKQQKLTISSTIKRLYTQEKNWIDHEIELVTPILRSIMLVSMLMIIILFFSSIRSLSDLSRFSGRIENPNKKE